MRPVESKLVSFRAQGVAVVAAGLLLACSAASAWAKGSEFEPDLPAYDQGETATLHVVFGRGSYEGTRSDGPFYGYLVRYPRWFSPGPIPDHATPLGRVRMRVAGGRRCCFLARMKFVVPPVADGTYAIQYCNDPCTVSGIGDLEPSPFWIGKSALEFRVDELDSARAESRERLTDTRSRLLRRIDRLRTQDRALARRVEALEARRASAVPDPARKGSAVPVVAALTAAVLAASLVVLRRRTFAKRARPDLR